MNNIILIGYMGSGKTTVGKRLAEVCSVPKKYIFVDTDELIVQQQQRSINEIFATDGELAFREMETELLKQLITEKSKNMILSTGGGMPVKEENRSLLSVLGTVIYLKANPQTIYTRIKDDTTRPLLQCENPMTKITEMITQRNPIYEASASMIVDTDKVSHSEVVNEIIRRMKTI